MTNQLTPPNIISFPRFRSIPSLIYLWHPNITGNSTQNTVDKRCSYSCICTSQLHGIFYLLTSVFINIYMLHILYWTSVHIQSDTIKFTSPVACPSQRSQSRPCDLQPANHSWVYHIWIWLVRDHKRPTTNHASLNLAAELGPMGIIPLVMSYIITITLD